MQRSHQTPARSLQALARNVDRGKRKRPVRARSVSLKTMGKRRTLEASRCLAAVIPLIEAMRPKTRGDCVDGPRPCPWVRCRHNLYLEVSPVKENGSLKVNFPDLEPEDMTGRLESCSLDVADRGPQGSERVGELLNITRERIRQIEERALKRVRLPLLRALDGLDGVEVE
jgi:hypothetical protein